MIMSKIEIKVPALGESITEATVSKWIKQEGDNIKKDEAILELETDKVTQEIYAASSGVLEKIFFKEGEDVKIGDILADIGVNDSKVESTKHEKFLKSKDLEEKEVNIKVPSLGESITEAVISKWLKKEEMVVKKGEPIVEIELLNSKTVTSDPNLFHTEPNSKPIYPPPITANFLGTFLNSNAPVDDTIFFSSIFILGIDATFEPVATKIFLVFDLSPLTSI